MSQFPKVRIIPLGGVDEIGKNMTAIEYEDDILVETAVPFSPTTICWASIW